MVCQILSVNPEASTIPGGKAADLRRPAPQIISCGNCGGPEQTRSCNFLLFVPLPAFPGPGIMERKTNASYENYLTGTRDKDKGGSVCIFMPWNASPADCRNQVIDYLSRMAETAAGFGVALCHENEKGIYADNAERCAQILDAVPSLRCVFDPANFIQCGQDVREAWALLGRRVYYMHIKDALADGTVVPAGKGIGCLPELLKDFSARGGEAVTLEPHLQVFEGLSDLEKDHKTPVPRFAYPTSDAAFDAACQALKALL